MLAISNIWLHNDTYTTIVWMLIFLAMVLNWWRAERDYMQCIMEKHEVVSMKIEAERKELNIKGYLESVQHEFLYADQDEFTTQEVIEYLDKEIEKWSLK